MNEEAEVDWPYFNKTIFPMEQLPFTPIL